jgi:hypothetical protein
MTARVVRMLVLAAALLTVVVPRSAGAADPLVAQISPPIRPIPGGVLRLAAPTLTKVEPTTDGYALVGSGFGADPGLVRVFEDKRAVPASAIVSVRNDRITVRSRPTGPVSVRVVVGGRSSAALAYTRPGPASCAKDHYGPACDPCPGLGASGGPACNGHGTCDDGILGTGRCACNPGFVGSYCQYSNATCSGHGNPDGTGGCTCTAGFAGAACGACAVNHYAYPTCRYCLASSTCSGNGACGPQGQCVCNAGFGGPNCATRPL